MRRIARGGEVLAPAPPGQRVQLIDVRDLADWIVLMAEERWAGTFNVTGPGSQLTIEGMLEELRAACDSAARVTWVGEKFLLDAGVAPWSELPLWLPDVPESEEDRGANQYFFHVNCDKAIAAGLRFRPLAETTATHSLGTRSARETRRCAPV